MAITTLPYPNLDFVPLDVLTAEELNQMMSNIKAINNATIGTEQLANSAVTSSKIANSAVTSSKIDWTTLKGSADMPFKVATGTHMYGTTYTVRRWGNTVQFQMSGRFNQNAPQSDTSSETIPVGYRPVDDVRGVGFIGAKIATCSGGNNGKLFYWCTGAPSNGDEFNLCMTYYTKDNFPS